MIADNENNEKYKAVPADDEQEEPQLTPQQMRSIFHLLVKTVKGLAVTQKLLDEYPEDAKINITFDEVNQIWRLWVPQPKFKKGIVLPKRRIIKPGMN